MRILCVIDSFVSGGAQRQMVELAVGLQSFGHDVEMFVYHPELDFFRGPVDEAGIRVHAVESDGGFSFAVLSGLVRVLRQGRHDAMISFLGSSNVYAELAHMAAPRTRLIVSERNSHLADGSAIPALLKRVLHVLAGRVVANNHTHAEWLRGYPWLRRKVATIYNGFALDGPDVLLREKRREGLRLLALGRVVEQKNVLGLIEALKRFHQRNGFVPEVSWAGRREGSTGGSRYQERVEALLSSNPVIKDRWHWLGERKDVKTLFAEHDALILPSLYEGLPNVVCEAFIAGTPVLASNVCDNPLLVPDGERGLLFDPEKPEDMARAIERFLQFDSGQRHRLAVNGNAYAVDHLSVERMVREYDLLLQDMTDTH